MITRVETKDVGDVKDKFEKSVGESHGVEDAHEEYIKKELKL